MPRALALLCLPLCSLALSACGNTTSTAAFKGEQHEAAQAIANLQADATAADEKKICTEDLAASVVARLGTTKGCEAAIKSQLTEVDSLEATIGSVQIAPDGTSASARVESIYEGRHRVGPVLLVKEDGKWKVSGLG
jgi:hypothetical protein